MHNEINKLARFYDFTIDLENKVLFHNGTDVELPLKAIELLCTLVEHQGKLVPREELFEAVWKDAFVEDSVLTQNIYQLRKVFKSFGVEDEVIKNVPRRGYRFVPQVDRVKQAEDENPINRTDLESPGIATEKEVAPDNHKSEERGDSKLLFKKRSLIYAVLALSLFSIGFLLWYSFASGSNQSNRMLNNLRLESLTDSGNAFIPTISRDKQHLAYVRNEKNAFSIVLKHLVTSSETVVVEPKNYELRSLNFSADGNYLFYIAREEDSPESTVYRVPIYGGPGRKLIANVRHYFSISPDGEHLAFFRYNPKKDESYLMTARIDGSEEKVISTRKPPYYYQVWQTYPSWSPDSRKIAISGYEQYRNDPTEKRTIYLLEVDLKTGDEKKIKHPQWQTALQPAWLQDGSGLVVSVREKPNQYLQFWRLSYPDGSAQRITNDTNDYPEFQLSSDSKSIIASNISNNSNLFLVALDKSRALRQLTTQTLGHSGIWGIEWTKDDKELVFVKSEGKTDGSLWKVNIETKEVEQITFDNAGEAKSPRMTPDGKSVLFSSNRSGKRHIWKIGLDGKNLQQFLNTESGEDYPEVSSDGKWLFYASTGRGGYELWKKPLDGGVASRVLEYAGGTSKISPADSSIIIAHQFDPTEKEGSPWKYVVFSHEKQSQKRLLRINPHNHSFEWNREGTGVYFAQRSMNENNIWFYSIENDDLERVTDLDGMKIVNIRISGDGKTLAFAGGSVTGNILEITGF